MGPGSATLPALRCPSCRGPFRIVAGAQRHGLSARRFSFRPPSPWPPPGTENHVPPTRSASCGTTSSSTFPATTDRETYPKSWP